MKPKLTLIRITYFCSFTFFALSCASGPKVSKNPAEEAALQTKAQAVIAAGQTESAKAGGYDPIPFWKNRSDVTDKYVSHSVKKGIFSRSKKIYVMDFKVKFKTHYRMNQIGGIGFLDKLAERTGTNTANGTTTVSTKERRTIHGFFELPDSFYQKVTDSIYEDFVTRLKEAGYELIARENIEYSDLKEYLASDKMVSSPQDGDDFVKIFAPTGWKLEKSTMDTPSLSAAFGDNLLKLGEQVSRKIDEGIAIAPTYIIDLGDMKDGKFQPTVGITSQIGTSQKYTFGGFEIAKPIKDGLPFNAEQTLKEEDKNSTGKAIAAVTALLTSSSQEYNTRDIYSLKPNTSELKPRIDLHIRYINDIIFQQIREGRDD